MSTSTVGLPRESKISRPKTPTISVIINRSFNEWAPRAV
jgi:hypothetical protein